MSRKLVGKVALVTGASRGIGKGIALQLGEAGATVYVTGRPIAKQDALSNKLQLPSLDQTATEVTSRGGRGIAVFCDHSDPNDIKKLFERIHQDQRGRLDILVNNAFSAVTTVSKSVGTKFYDLDPSVYDEINNVGLRNHYICSVYAAKLMVPRKSGLIVTVSSSGGLSHLFNTAYGVGKAGKDRLAADMAHELQESNICSVSLWPGPVKTELITKTVLRADKHPNYAIFSKGETIEFSGKCVVALATDPAVMEKTGRILPTSQLAKDYDLFDEGGSQPIDDRVEAHGDLLKALNDVRAPTAKL